MSLQNSNKPIVTDVKGNIEQSLESRDRQNRQTSNPDKEILQKIHLKNIQKEF